MITVEEIALMDNIAEITEKIDELTNKLEKSNNAMESARYKDFILLLTRRINEITIKDTLGDKEAKICKDAPAMIDSEYDGNEAGHIINSNNTFSLLL